jgi:hypothetical protein
LAYLSGTSSHLLLESSSWAALDPQIIHAQVRLGRQSFSGNLEKDASGATPVTV